MSTISSAIFNLIERRVTPFAGKLSSQRHVNAIRDGFIAAMPFLIVGSFMLLFAHPPFEATSSFTPGRWWYQISLKYSNQLLMPFNMTMGLMSLFVTSAIAYQLAVSYKLNALMAASLALMAFLLVSAPQVNDALSVSALGGEGIFTGILVALFCTELMRFLRERNIGLKLPEQVPPNIRQSFDLLIPILIVFITLYPLSLYVQAEFGMLIPQAIMAVFSPIVTASDSLPALLLTVLLCHILWFAGIHGAAIIGGLLQAFYITNLGMNQEALNAGMPIPHIFVEAFWMFFVVIGGSGATLGLVILFLRSRSAHLKSIGKLGIVPSMFNINEPVIFGSPIIMNPVLFIPFISIPLINATIAWTVTKLGLIGHVVSLAPWTTPAPIGAVWATGWDYRALILVMLLIALSMIIYYPFFKVYEKQLISQKEK